jgi:hypothetical protein
VACVLELPMQFPHLRFQLQDHRNQRLQTALG